MFEILLAWDAAAARACSSLAGWPPLDVVMTAATTVGLHGAIWIVVGVVLAYFRRGHVLAGLVRLGWSLLLTSVVVSLVLKPLVQRPRPDFAGGSRTGLVAAATSRTTGYSFPSGHASLAVAGAYALSLMWPRRRALLWAIAGLVAVSRLYLGVHYPLDIVAGLAVGWCVARVATGGAPCYISGSANMAWSVPR